MSRDREGGGGPGPTRADVRDEIEFYVEERARELEARGMEPAEARRAAEAAFGDMDRITEEVLAVDAPGGTTATTWRTTMEGWVQDLRYGARQLARSPGFTLAAVLTLALGIGADAAVWSVTESVFLQAPPVRDPGSLVALYTTCRDGTPRCSSSYPDLVDYRERATALAGLAGRSSNAYSVAEEGRAPDLLTTYLVTGDYFDVLGVRPALGRLLQPADHEPLGPVPVGVLAWDTWTSRFGSDPSIVGRDLRVNGVPIQVVGVAPEGFRGTSLTGEPELFLPMATGSLLGSGEVAGPGAESVWEARGSRWIDVLVGRLAPGATADALQEEMARVARDLNEAYPDARGERSAVVDRIARYALPQFARDELRRFVLVLGGVVAATLLLACANLANLLLSRATARRPEMGVRLALGGSRGRIVRQLLTESVLLALLGGAAGLAVAGGLLAVLGSASLPGEVALSRVGVGLDATVFLFALGLTVATGLAFGLVPALRAARTDVVTTIRGAADPRRGGDERLRKILVGVQVAICVVLLFGSGLFLRTLRNGLTTDLGFRSEGLALARFSLGDLGYAPADAVTALERARLRVEALPGVSAASYGTRVPLQIGGSTATLARIDGYEPAPDEEIRVEFILAGPRFLAALGAAPVRGEDPLVSGATGDALLVSPSMAERYWAGRDPLSGTVALGGADRRVAGVTGDIHWRDVEEEGRNYAVLPFAAAPSFATRTVTFAARTRGDAEALLPELRDALRGVEPELTFYYVRTADDLLGSALATQRLGALLLSAFAFLALALAAVGIGGVVAYAVQRRRRATAVRLALGASRGRVVAGLVGEMAVPVLVGLAVGGWAAGSLGALADAFLLGVEPRDPATLLATASALLAVALVATLVPARRAAATDPMAVLRDE